MSKKQPPDVGALLLWYSAWLAANGPDLKSSPPPDLNKVVNRFLKEDADMVQRFMNRKDWV